MPGKLLTVREVSEILLISEKEVIDSVDAGKIPAYRIAGEFLRFQKDQIDLIKERYQSSQPPKKYNRKERIKDFFYFNDFYIASLAIILILVMLVFNQS
ncbi:helix-turn-helix domain-containing protein [Candidatus Omnitrophota bacterium]